MLAHWAYGTAALCPLRCRPERVSSRQSKQSRRARTASAPAWAAMTRSRFTWQRTPGTANIRPANRHHARHRKSRLDAPLRCRPRSHRATSASAVTCRLIRVVDYLALNLSKTAGRSKLHRLMHLGRLPQAVARTRTPRRGPEEPLAMEGESPPPRHRACAIRCSPPPVASIVRQAARRFFSRRFAALSLRIHERRKNPSMLSAFVCLARSARTDASRHHRAPTGALLPEQSLRRRAGRQLPRAQTSSPSEKYNSSTASPSAGTPRRGKWAGLKFLAQSALPPPRAARGLELRNRPADLRRSHLR
jgi:hypothetical protein